MNYTDFLNKLNKVCKTADGHTALCPAHDDRNPSLSVGYDERTGKILIKCFAGCTTDQIIGSMGLSMADLQNGDGKSRRKSSQLGPIVATYDYTNESGELVFQVTRHEPKTFRQRRPDGNGGWAWGLGGVKRILYNLPAIVALDSSEWVFIVEGEKDADRLNAQGLCATTNSGGADKWHLTDQKPLTGRLVAILPDNDPPGEKHIMSVAKSLHGIAEEVRIVRLTDLPPKGDVSDWLDGGHTTEELLQLVSEASTHEPKQSDNSNLLEPDPEDPQGWALDHAADIAELEVADRERLYLKLKQMGAGARWVDKNLEKVVNAERRTIRTEGGPSVTWADYQDALHQLGYTFTLNTLDDSPEANGERLNDPLEAVILMRMHDLGHDRADWVRRAFVAAAHENRYNPMVDLLNSLKWDGEDHIARLERYIYDDHDQITYDDGSRLPVFGAWLKRWGVGAVAKALAEKQIPAQNPMLVLISGQGLGKSTLARWMCPDNRFFVEEHISPDNKDHQMLLTNTLVWEVAELGATTKHADREKLKAFLTRRDVTFRAPYGRYSITKPARTSFIGTINPELGFLNDVTGARRFLPIELKHIDRGYSKDIDPLQLWAQFVAMYRAGEGWELTPEETVTAELIRRGNEIEQEMMAPILRYYRLTENDADELEAGDIVKRLMDAGYTRANQTTVGLALKALGLESYRPKKGGRSMPTRYKGIRDSVPS